jgi:Tol biopolymer transport system component
VVVLKNKALLSIMLAVLMGAGLLALVEPSKAAFPGQNGKIAFSSDRSGNVDIWTVTSTGSPTLNRITDNTETDQEPAWSPGGSRIAFASDRSGNVEIYTVDNSTGMEVGLDRITDNLAIDEKPAWSPDGSKIVFNSNRSGVN